MVFQTKLLPGAKPFNISFDKVDGFIKVYDGTRFSIIWP